MVDVMVCTTYTQGMSTHTSTSIPNARIDTGDTVARRGTEWIGKVVGRTNGNAVLVDWKLGVGRDDTRTRRAWVTATSVELISKA